jgi:TonB family protein
MIKASLIVLSALLVLRLFRNQSAAIRHWVLAVSIACAAIVPLLELVVPAWDIRARPAVEVSQAHAASPDGDYTIAVVSTMPPTTQYALTTSVSVWSWARRAWVAGAVLGVLSLIAGLARLRWLAVHAEPLREGRWADAAAALTRELGITRPIVLLQSRHPALLVTWGMVHPRILLPATARTWSTRRIQIVLRHELAHVRRRDWIAQLLAEFIRAVYWFNPLFWISSRRLRQESERACDDEVLRGGVAAADYASHVLALARAARRQRYRMYSAFPAPAMARQSNLERRVRAMLNSGLNRTPATRVARVIAVCGLLTFSVLVSGFGAAAQSFVTLSGSVTDPNNGTIPGVTVTLTNLQSRAKHEVRSNDVGIFEFVGLPAGEYELEGSLPGFRQTRVPVSIAGHSVRQDLQLKVGSITESIVITPAAGTRNDYRTAQPSAPRAAVTTRECRVSASGGEIRAPTKVTNVNPVYPDNPDTSMQGIVILEGRVGTDGTVGQVRVQRSPHPELTRAAIDAFEQWRFTPTLLNCVPIEVEITATMTFTLQK